jgi:exoribonuclease-2
MTSVDLDELARRAMIERGLEPDFPAAAIAQVKRLKEPAVDSVPDQRHLPWCSIDNDDSRDLDQLTVAETTRDGSARVLIAIADVDVLVVKDSPLDDHAQQNTTSVYTPSHIFPMLPERLSTDLTSLNPDEDRIAVVISFVVDREGAVSAGDVGRAVVRNRAKLAYNSVAAWLDSNSPMPGKMAAADGVADQVRLQDEIASRLRARRYEAGALDLESTEARAVVTNGRVEDLRRDEKNRAKALIEDFMIAANGTTARYLEDKGLPSIRRIVRTPKRWDRIQVLAREAGDRLPDEPDPKALSDFLTRRRQADPLRFPDLSLSVVKLLGRGEYILTRAGDEEGHFGLAVTDYVHSTAPNRRYPDLITQRLLKAAIAGKASPYTSGELESLATHCTKQEDAAEKVERQMRKSAAALVLSSRIGDRFDAIVTGASPKGTWVRTFNPPAEGRVVRGFEGMDVGEQVRVRLTNTDVTRGFIDFVGA